MNDPDDQLIRQTIEENKEFIRLRKDAIKNDESLFHKMSIDCGQCNVIFDSVFSYDLFHFDNHCKLGFKVPARKVTIIYEYV